MNSCHYCKSVSEYNYEYGINFCGSSDCLFKLCNSDNDFYNNCTKNFNLHENLTYDNGFYVYLFIGSKDNWNVCRKLGNPIGSLAESYNFIKDLLSKYKNENELKNYSDYAILKKQAILFGNKKVTKYFDTNKDLGTNGIVCYTIVHDMYTENTFRNLQKESNQEYLFHGSNISNWYSILYHSIQNYSGTSRMSCGQAYGPGIYLSDMSSFSDGYCGYSKTADNIHVMGIYMLYDKELYKKSCNIYVVEDNKKLLLRHLLIYNTTTADHSTVTNFFKTLEINRQKVINNKQTNQIPKLFSTMDKTGPTGPTGSTGHKSMKRILKEYSELVKSGPNYGLFIDSNENNLLEWIVLVKDFDKNSLLYNDLQKINRDNVRLCIKIPEDYPFKPPFIYIQAPIFQIGTAHVTSGGSICTEMLTNQGWSSLMSIENVLIQIKALILEGSGRLNNNGINKIYNEKDALVSFQNVARSHGWT